MNNVMSTIKSALVPSSIKEAYSEIKNTEGNDRHFAVAKLVVRVAGAAAVAIAACAAVAIATAMFASISPIVGGILGVGLATSIITGAALFDTKIGDMVLSVGLIGAGLLLSVAHPLLGGGAFAAYALKNVSTNGRSNPGFGSTYVNQAAAKLVEGYEKLCACINNSGNKSQLYEDA